MNGKRLSGLLALCLLLGLTACGGGGERSSPGDGSEPPSVSTLAPAEEPDQSQEPEEPVYPYAAPLTGEGLMEDVSGQRPIAIMLNNLSKALPQAGVAQADVIYEIVAEGGITRMLALFQDVEGVGEIGTVRSARDYYVSLAYGHDAIFLHAGGSPQAYDLIQSLGMTALDCVNGPYEGDLFWRDQERRQTAGLEHSVLTSGQAIQELLPTYSRVDPEHRADFSVGWTFDEEAPAGGEPARVLTVPFSNYKTGVFTYDGATDRYWILQHINGADKEYVDANSGERVEVSNVLVLYTDVSRVPGDTAGRMSVRTTGSGEGLLCRNGQRYPIRWEREGQDRCYSFLDQAGQPIPLDVGSSYINVVASSAEVFWE